MSLFRRKLKDCYENLREVLPQNYTSEGPLELDHLNLVKNAFPNATAGRWRLLRRAKTYIEHLESVIEQLRKKATGDSEANDNNLTSGKSFPAYQSKFLNKVKVGFLNEYALDKSITDYTFDLSESSDEENFSENFPSDCLDQNRSRSTALQPDSMSTGQINSNFSSVLFIPINVKPATKGTPMYVNACASTSQFKGTGQ